MRSSSILPPTGRCASLAPRAGSSSLSNGGDQQEGGQRGHHQCRAPSLSLRTGPLIA